MSTRSTFILSACALFVCAPLAQGQTPTARVATYAQNGTTHFAISLMPNIKADPAQKIEVVILVDTSASQAGKYRDGALAAVDSLLANLRPTDRVLLMAVDTKAVPMSAGFVAAGSPEMRAGVAKLHGRAPLGATDLEAGLRSAASQFATADTARTVIYVGDAMSKANTFSEVSLGNLVTGLRNKQVSISGFVIGMEQNTQLLAALANHTGGMVALDGAAGDAPVTSGRALADSVHASVIWPSDMKMSVNVATAYPMLAPPLRSDRDSILVGTLGQGGEVSVDVDGTLNGKPVATTFKATAERSNEDF
ncbi:MAG TPA: VWA domain-containing protein, partial [Pirellulaceae bacterium]|nr:VWA domain-containing protein [Pirellulaceae bacterium]